MFFRTASVPLAHDHEARKMRAVQKSMIMSGLEARGPARFTAATNRAWAFPAAR